MLGREFPRPSHYKALNSMNHQDPLPLYSLRLVSGVDPVKITRMGPGYSHKINSCSYDHLHGSL